MLSYLEVAIKIESYCIGLLNSSNHMLYWGIRNMTQEEAFETSFSISDLNPKMRRASVRFRVVVLEKPRQVKSKRTGKILSVSNATIADETARITLTLWNDDVDSLVEGQCYKLRNGRIEIFDESMRLSRGFSGKFIPLDECIETINLDLNMSKPFMGRTPRRRRERSKEGRTFKGIPGRDQRGYCSSKDF